MLVVVSVAVTLLVSEGGHGDGKFGSKGGHGDDKIGPKGGHDGTSTSTSSFADLTAMRGTDDDEDISPSSTLRKYLYPGGMAPP